jgi:hypothetical protein
MLKEPEVEATTRKKDWTTEIALLFYYERSAIHNFEGCRMVVFVEVKLGRVLFKKVT